MDVSPVNNTQPTRINKPESKSNVNTSILSYIYSYILLKYIIDYNCRTNIYTISCENNQLFEKPL